LPQATKKTPPGTDLHAQMMRLLREALLFLLLAVAGYLLLSLASYDAADPGWSHSGGGGPVRNLGGTAGAWFADIFLYLFGYFAYLFPLMVAYWGWLAFRGIGPMGQAQYLILALRWTGFLLTLAAGSGLATLHYGVVGTSLPVDSGGGILGDLVGGGLQAVFSFLGATLFLLALFLIGITLFTGLSWLTVMEAIGRWTLYGLESLQMQWKRFAERRKARQDKKARKEKVKKERKRVQKRPPVRIEPKVTELEVSERVEREKQVPLFEPTADADLPPLALLDEASHGTVGYSEQSLEAMSRQVEFKLRDFGVEVEVKDVHPGPVITRFELEPAPGVKAAKITNLARDLARSLSVMAVRVVEVIPGKSYIGLEIPNEQREIVHLSEILRSREYDKANSPLTLALGKDIGGNPVVVDLARMPHLLVAGTTGSGKSVAINAMVLSLLYKSTARDVRLIMVDPKMLELSVYDGIPHLLAPVVTDMKEAANALRWCVAEMERRYRLMAALGVRNLNGFNRKVRDAARKGQPIADPMFQPADPFAAEPEPAPVLEALPHLVVIVDELADLMMVVGKKVEELIARLAQKARAAGIHLILATQRPSVDVITGLIKANIPTRIAFQVSSRVDSRTILDQIGAEHLLGHGDMLYLPPGTAIPVRVHGAFVDDHEVHNVVEHLKRMGEPEYLDEVLQGGDGDAAVPGLEPAGGGSDEDDPLYDQAVRIVTETRRASISGVQRRLKIGYNRAARLVEAMEAAGIVGPLESNGNREVLAPPPPED
jgi:S-DNA-T family DNA segregation ATPase FtsK/SpoIIIE